jgi:hypothetical protein
MLLVEAPKTIDLKEAQPVKSPVGMLDVPLPSRTFSSFPQFLNA